MSLENVPEMLVNGKKEVIHSLPDYNPREPFDLGDRPINYGGKFITLKNKGDGRTILFSANRAGAHAGLYDLTFNLKQLPVRLPDPLNLVPPTNDGTEYLELHATGGGILEINDTSVIISGKSDSYGPYDPEIVRPIVERWVGHNLPNHTITFI